jgi:mono/diheme cytochrome c family protein
MPRFTRLVAITGVGFIVAAFTASVNAQTTGAQPAPKQAIKEAPIRPVADIAGGATFKAYCTSCHGTLGKGNGPAASALKVPPADLTQIWKKAGGKFPFATVKSQITGDDVIAAHGSRDMPTWGPLFNQVEASKSVAELRLTNLIKYIEELQEK